MRNRDASSTSNSETRGVWWSLLLPCLAVLIAFGWGMFAHREELSSAGKNESVADVLPHRFEKWREATYRGIPTVMFGDSLNMCVTPPSKTVDRVGRFMRLHMLNAGRDIELFDLTMPGLQPLQFYSMLDEVLIRPIELVVIEINLRAFTDPSLRPGAERLPQMSRSLDFAEAYALRANLELDGLTLFDPALMRVKDDLGLLYAFDGLRELALEWVAQTNEAASAALGLPKRIVPSFGAWMRRLDRTYVVDYADHPVAKTLRVLVERLRRAGIPVLLYVAPINVEALRSGPVFDDALVARRLDELRRTIGAAPHEWLDLHELLSSAMFRDPQNHITLEGCPTVGGALARRALRILARSEGRAPADDAAPDDAGDT